VGRVSRCATCVAVLRSAQYLGAWRPSPGMGIVISVSIEIESVVIAAEEDVAGAVERIEAGLQPGRVDPDLLLWLLDAAVVRAKVTAV
jgi:hypothetical protein